MDELSALRSRIDEADRSIAEGYETRMRAVTGIAEYKAKNGLPVLDSAREAAVVEKNLNRLTDASFRPGYEAVLRTMLSESRKYQAALLKLQEPGLPAGTLRSTVSLGENSYDILLGHGLLSHAGELLKLNRKVLIVTDDGVPAVYAQTVAAQCGTPVIRTVPQGEDSKSLATFETLLGVMLEEGFSRNDCVVAVGGGVMGDLAGFCASAYMRGIDFYNIPTTTLSQVDSSVGGKTAVNFHGIKNIIGAFYQPKRVLIDMDVLKTLPPRQISSGLAEALKMSVTSDPELFSIFENEDIPSHLDTIIFRAVEIKRKVVEQDEKEGGLRKILNFGHTLGHGVESAAELHGVTHGECVALGMLPMCGETLRARLLPILKKLNLPTAMSFDRDAAMKAVLHDKKGSNGTVTVILSDAVGSWSMAKLDADALREKMNLISSEETL